LGNTFPTISDKGNIPIALGVVVEGSFQIEAGRSAVERLKLSQYMFAIFIPAMIAIIVFGDIANATDRTKLLVAFASVIGNVSIYMFVSGAIRTTQAIAKDMTPEERASASGQDIAKAPWAFYNIYTIVATGGAIVVMLMAIYQ
jgi:hypothetical protein